MQTANIMLSLNAGNDVPKRGVSAAEIAVLIAIHGDDAVSDVEPTGSSDTIDIDGAEVKWTNRVELDRLRRKYGRAKDGEDKAIVENLFPGAAARVFETLDELNLPDTFYKATSRHKPEAAPAEPEVEAVAPAPHPLDHDGDGKKGGSKRRAKKAEPAADIDTVEAAEGIAPGNDAAADEVSDGITDMPDNGDDSLFK
jgi:hypothetical protein